MLPYFKPSSIRKLTQIQHEVETILNIRNGMGSGLQHNSIFKMQEIVIMKLELSFCRICKIQFVWNDNEFYLNSFKLMNWALFCCLLKPNRNDRRYNVSNNSIITCQLFEIENTQYRNVNRMEMGLGWEDHGKIIYSSIWIFVTKLNPMPIIILIRILVIDTNQMLIKMKHNNFSLLVILRKRKGDKVSEKCHG